MRHWTMQSVDAAKHVHGLHGDRSLSVLIIPFAPCVENQTQPPQDFPNSFRKFTVTSKHVRLDERDSQEE